ncbi:MAG: hypothetical protein ACFFAS_08185 [Promethearchaeota archaeon]
MSLDKWVNPEKKKQEKTEKKKKEVKKKQKIESFKKYILSCPKKKCNYQKIMMKRHLNEEDKKCPRCKEVMKIKIANNS